MPAGEEDKHELMKMTTWEGGLYYAAWVMNLISSGVDVNIYYEYVNTGNQSAYFEIFKTIDKYEHKQKLTFNWHYDYDDEDAFEMGQLLAEQLNSKVIFIEIE